MNETQRKYFADNIDVVQEFLGTEDGADSVELLVDTFSHFIKSKTPPEEAAPAEPLPAPTAEPDEP